MRILIVISMLLFLVYGGNGIIGQKARDAVRASAGKPTGCELNDAVLDTLSQKTKRDQIIIVVARVGTSETRDYLNRRRLHNVLVYLTQFVTPEGGRRKGSEIVLAEGESKSADGIIELYAEGKLFDTLRPAHNADLYLGTCVPDQPGQDVCRNDSDKNFYPCLDKTKLK